jgi:hypothetical protein
MILRMVFLTDSRKWFNALRFAARGPAAQGRGFFFAYPALIPQRASASRKRTGLSVVPDGTGVFCKFEFVIFFDGVKRAGTTPGASPGVSFFVCAGAARYGSPEGFRAAGLHGSSRENSLMRHGNANQRRGPSTPAYSQSSLAVGQDDRGKKTRYGTDKSVP